MSSSDVLKRAREYVNWESKDNRTDFLRKIRPSISHWQGQLPNFRDIFRPEEMKCLFMDSACYDNTDNHYEDGAVFIDFVARSGYKDKPEVDEDGKPPSRRTTPLHLLYEARKGYLVADLFKIYDRFDVNYTDETGRSHFHIACEFGCDDVVQKFLEFGQDPNILVPHTGDSPLHLALKNRKKKVAAILLRTGANPNIVNVKRLTPLHIIYMNRFNGHEMAELLFEICNEKHQTILIDTRDKMRRTPLQWAVANLMPKVVDVLLDYGADLSNFFFSNYNQYHFDGPFNRHAWSNLKFTAASDALIIVESLEKRGYDFIRSDTLTILLFFFKHGLFQESGDVEKSWYNEEFASQAKTIMIYSNLSLHDLIRLRPKEAAAKRLAYTDYIEFMHSDKFGELPYKFKDACTVHLWEKMSNRFFRRCALKCFLKLINYRLPILCCEIIIMKLMYEDLHSVFLALAAKSSW